MICLSEVTPKGNLKVNRKQVVTIVCVRYRVNVLKPDDDSVRLPKLLHVLVQGLLSWMFAGQLEKYKPKSYFARL